MRLEISELPHHEIMKLIKSINALAKSNFKYGEPYRKSAEKIYKHRNDYLHSFQLPEASVFMTNITRIELESLMNPFIQSHESGLFLSFLDGYRGNKDVQEIICREISKKRGV